MRRLTAILGNKIPTKKTGESLYWDKAIASRYTAEPVYALSISGKTYQYGLSTSENPVSVQCVKTGTKIIVCGKNQFDYGAMKLKAENVHCIESSFINNGFYAKGDTLGSWSTADANGALSITQYISAPAVISFNYEILSQGEYNYLSVLLKFADGSVQYNNISNLSVGDSGRAVVKLNGSTSSFMIMLCQHGVNITNIQIESGTEETSYEEYKTGGYVETPCDLYDGETCYWYANLTEVIRTNGTLPATETFPAQPLPRTFNGITQIIQQPVSLSGTITGTMLRPYMFNRLRDKSGAAVKDKNGKIILMG